jgi:hypothetical protein
MERDQERAKGQHADEHDHLHHAEQADAGTSFTSNGQKPHVDPHFQVPSPTASEQAYGTPETPAVKAVKALYARGETGTEHIAQIIIKSPADADVILNFVSKQSNGPSELEVKLAVDRIKREAAGPHRDGKDLALHPLAPKLGLTGATKTNDQYDNAENKFNAEQARDQERALDPNKDKTPNPVGDYIDRRLHGAPPNSKEQQTAEDKLTNALHPPDAGTQAEIPGIKKRFE